MKFGLAVALASLLFAPSWLPAQSSPVVASNPEFEVASVKPTKSGGLPPFVRSPDRFAMRAPLRVLIQNAYQLLQDGQLVGGPVWLTSDRFDVVAKVPDNTSPEQMPLMLRALLADRFKLVVHTESRELPIYALVLARGDGKLGERIRPGAFDCLGARANRQLPIASQPRAQVSCVTRFRPGNVMARGTSLAQLADHLARFVDRVVIDQTGLAGNFDLDLEWTPDNWRMAPDGPQLSPDIPRLPPVNPDGPSLFTALREQLGLRLESARAPVKVLVIDSVEQPMPD